jgi:molybdate transport system permease protein
MLDAADAATIWLTLKLACTVTALLLAFGTPLAWWLARSRARMRHVVGAVVALPLVLPPTVLGFYLLFGLGLLPFTFAGLTLASVCYSLPFVVQPLQNAFEAIGERPLEAAATLGAGPWDRFWSVAVPLARPGFLSAAVLGFAHTIGEFGIVLMIGGNIPGQTRMLSVLIYDHVEAMEYAQAHWLAGGMLAFSFLVLLALYSLYPQAIKGRA